MDRGNSRPPADDNIWEFVGFTQRHATYKCKPCKRNVYAHHRKRHEEQQIHKLNLTNRFWDLPARQDPPLTFETDPLARQVIGSATFALVHSFTRREGPGEWSPPPSPPIAGLSAWLPDNAFNPATSMQEEQLERVRETMQTLEQELWTQEQLWGGDEPEGPRGTVEGDAEAAEQGHYRKRRDVNELFGADSRWYPWPDKVTCSLDILMHLPRSVFSRPQLELFLWLLHVNGVEDLPSVDSVEGWCRDIQKLYGIDTLTYQGAFGHPYSVNSLNQILAQELANPRVRPKLSVYPEDSGVWLSEARQGKRWLSELPNELTTPWMEIGHGSNKKTYFTNEPAFLSGGRFCVPVRWIQKKDGPDYALCWQLQPVQRDDRVYWQAITSTTYEVPIHEFLKPFPELKVDMVDHSDLYEAPGPIYEINEMFDATTGLSTKWPSDLSSKDGSVWRQRSGGKPVYALPLHLYCDDTSGNKSKKWNKHNSWLFTLAGLPRREVSRDSNVHFLSTSNLAPPLEMLDGIADQIEAGQQEGVWAWDAERGEAVMFFPVVLDLLGDNPMQSEMACHIGMRGRKYCRVCHATGAKGLNVPGEDEGSDMGDAEDPDLNFESLFDSLNDRDAAPPRQPSTVDPSLVTQPIGENPSSIHNLVPPADPSQPEQPPGVFHAGVDFIRERLSHAIHGATSRSADETTQVLLSYFEDAMTVGNEGRIGKNKTATGVKDTFQNHFLGQIFDSYKTRRAEHTKAAALKEWWDNFNKSGKDVEDMINPVWRLRGLDAHQDTPIEILHVVLLGMVKYFWRDAINHQLKNKKHLKEELAIRLEAVDTHGLGISRLDGETLVNYNGSLVGRDFRAIAQVAPFVLKGLVSEECYATWVSLSKLIPLIWQPEIPNIVEYKATLQKEIEQFLLRTAAWTGRWFNKPKFHLLIHLPEHIHRFGPAILFATETFESYNAIIRAKSIHSNRQAPSRDIARAFAQWNRLRHFISGGSFVRLRTDTFMEAGKAKRIDHTRPSFTHDKFQWASAGPGAQEELVGIKPVSKYLGLEDAFKRKHHCQRIDKNPLPYSQMQAAQYHLDRAVTEGQFYKCKHFVLENNDVCHREKFVVAKSRETEVEFVARIVEIAQRKGDTSGDPAYVLVQHYERMEPGNPQGMPYLVGRAMYSMLEPADIVCAVNVQHSCSELSCEATGSKTRHQERQETGLTRRIIEHKHPLNLIVLNTAQMHAARHVQPFRIATEPLDVDRTIQCSAEAMFDEVSRGTEKTTVPSSDANAGGVEVGSTVPAPTHSSDIPPVAGTTAGTSSQRARGRGTGGLQRGGGRKRARQDDGRGGNSQPAPALQHEHQLRLTTPDGDFVQGSSRCHREDPQPQNQLRLNNPFVLDSTHHYDDRDRPLMVYHDREFSGQELARVINHANYNHNSDFSLFHPYAPPQHSNTSTHPSMQAFAQAPSGVYPYPSLQDQRRYPNDPTLVDRFTWPNMYPTV